MGWVVRLAVNTSHMHVLCTAFLSVHEASVVQKRLSCMYIIMMRAVHVVIG